MLGFPCNQFGDQEPDDAETIVENVKEEYGSEFPIFDKIDVFGENASPAFRNLVGECLLSGRTCNVSLSNKSFFG